MRKYDKSLTEVWEWKEKVYDETKGLSSKDYIRKMKSDADVVLSGTKVELRSIAFANRKRALGDGALGDILYSSCQV